MVWRSTLGSDLDKVQAWEGDRLLETIKLRGAAKAALGETIGNIPTDVTTSLEALKEKRRQEKVNQRLDEEAELRLATLRRNKLNADQDAMVEEMFSDLRNTAGTLDLSQLDADAETFRPSGEFTGPMQNPYQAAFDQNPGLRNRFDKAARLDEREYNETLVARSGALGGAMNRFRLLAEQGVGGGAMRYDDPDKGIRVNLEVAAAEIERLSGLAPGTLANTIPGTYAEAMSRNITRERPSEEFVGPMQTLAGVTDKELLAGQKDSWLMDAASYGKTDAERWQSMRIAYELAAANNDVQNMSEPALAALTQRQLVFTGLAMSNQASQADLSMIQESIQNSATPEFKKWATDNNLWEITDTETYRKRLRSALPPDLRTMVELAEKSELGATSLREIIDSPEAALMQAWIAGGMSEDTPEFKQVMALAQKVQDWRRGLEESAQLTTGAEPPSVRDAVSARQTLYTDLENIDTETLPVNVATAKESFSMDILTDEDDGALLFADADALIEAGMVFRDVGKQEPIKEAEELFDIDGNVYIEAKKQVSSQSMTMQPLPVSRFNVVAKDRAEDDYGKMMNLPSGEVLDSFWEEMALYVATMGSKASMESIYAALANPSTLDSFLRTPGNEMWREYNLTGLIQSGEGVLASSDRVDFLPYKTLFDVAREAGHDYSAVDPDPSVVAGQGLPQTP
jgi:hypothetical protein